MNYYLYLLQLSQDDPALLEKCAELLTTLLEQLIWLLGVFIPPDSPIDLLIIGLIVYLVLK